MINIKTVKFSDGRRESHAIVRPAFRGSFDEQLNAVRDTIAGFEFPPLMVRYFVSDAANQVVPLSNEYAVSVIQQPPLTGEKVVAWVWMRSDASPVAERDGFWSQADASTTMLLSTGVKGPSREALESLDKKLKARGGSLADSCMRTWLFVRDIDVNYADVVKGRNLAFESTGMNIAGHFIASTGIQGSVGHPEVTLVMDSVSYLGVPHGKVKYLNAPEFLNPTIEYGVAFERATAIDLPGRRQVFVSGTASINNRGEVEHPGDIVRQTERMIRNVEALLAEAGCSMSDAMHFLIYLRDGADAPVVDRLFESRYPDVPRVILLAPVCRPQWLIEMECMAVK